jgi:phosphoglycerate dehydrogenase-like enzyme
VVVVHCSAPTTCERPPAPYLRPVMFISLLKLVLPQRLRPYLAQLPSEVDASWFTDTDSCAQSVVDAEVLWLDFSVKSVERVIQAGTELRWVTTEATGVEGWPLALLIERNLTLTNGAGLGAIPIAEYVVMALLAGLKGLPALTRAQDQRQWLRRPPAFDELFGKRALILGYGGIGRAIGDRLRPFGVSVIGVRRRPSNEPGIIPAAEWEQLLPNTDVLILSVPLTGTTRSIVGEAQLSALPKGAWIVNVARGGLIDEGALIGALKSGHLGGAYLDVAQTEPLPPESELWSLPGVILTPHSAWATNHILERAADLFLENLSRYRRGEALHNVVGLQAGY